MQATTDRSLGSRVTARFASSALSFALPQGATIGDLARRLAARRLSKVTVKLDS